MWIVFAILVGALIISDAIRASTSTPSLIEDIVVKVIKTAFPCPAKWLAVPGYVPELKPKAVKATVIVVKVLVVVTVAIILWMVS